MTQEKQIELPEWMDEQDWLDFLKHRKQIKKPMTEIAKKRMLLKLDRMRQAGENISDVLDRSIVNGWQDVFRIPEDQKQSKPLSHRDHKPQHEEISEEQRQENLKRLNEMTASVFKVVPGGSKR